MIRKTVAWLVGTTLVGTGLLLSTPASAQFAKPEDAVKYRQSALSLMGNHMGRLSAMAQGKAPYDAASAQRSAEVVSYVSHLPWEGFVPGSGPEAVKTNAKPELFKNMDEVRSLAKKATEETAKLPGAAGSLETLRTQVGATGKACKDCHDKYREKI